MGNCNYLLAHVLVNCVIFGFDGKKLSVLLVEKTDRSDAVSNLKLPGRLICNEENMDQAAERVLYEMTGLKKIAMKQFKCFNLIECTPNSEDSNRPALEYGDDIDRLMIVTYLSLVKIDRTINVPKSDSAMWYSVDDMPASSNRIIKESLKEIQEQFANKPQMAFELLPSKFTALQLRMVYEAMYHRKYDVRNFHKKLAQLDYIVPLDERQKNVSHRAARYYRFDKVQYKRKMACL